MRRLIGYLVTILALIVTSDVAAQEGEAPQSAPEPWEGDSSNEEPGDSEAALVEPASVEEALTDETATPETTTTETSVESTTQSRTSEVAPSLESMTDTPVSVTDTSTAGEIVVEPVLESSADVDLPSDEEAPAESEERASRSYQGGEQVWSDSLPFRGTQLTYENIFNAYKLNRDAELTYNPEYSMSLSIQPRWYFTDALSARLRFDIEGEITNADNTTEYHETLVSDLLLDFVYNPIVTIPALEIDVGLGVRFQFPTSLVSQAETRYLGLGPDIRLSRVFNLLDGLLISYDFRYLKYLTRYTTRDREKNPHGQSVSDPEFDTIDHYTPRSINAFDQTPDPTQSHRFVNSLMISLDFLAERFRPMSLAMMVVFSNYLSNGPSEEPVEVDGRLITPRSSIHDPQIHTATIWYIFELSIDITDYITAAVGTSTLNPQLQPNSTYYTPFFNRYTNVYVDLTLDIERVVAAVRR